MDITSLNVQCESCGEIVQPEGPRNSLMYALAIGAIFALFFGFGVGGTFGIATAGIGFTAVVPLGIIGAYAGYKTGKWAAGKRDGVSCPECAHTFEKKSRVEKLRSFVSF